MKEYFFDFIAKIITTNDALFFFSLFLRVTGFLIVVLMIKRLIINRNYKEDEEYY